MRVICPRIEDGNVTISFVPCWDDTLCTACGHPVRVDIESVHVALRQDGAAEVVCLDCVLARAGVRGPVGEER